MTVRALASLVTLALLAAPAPAADADLILHHGKVDTVDPAFSIRQAVAVQGGKILRVGTDEDVLKTRGPRTEVIDLGGQTVLPGLIDSHVHPGGAAMTEFDHPIPDMETVQDVLDYVRGRAKALPEGAWIEVRQVFITRLREPRYPTNAALEAINRYRKLLDGNTLTVRMAVSHAVATNGPIEAIQRAVRKVAADPLCHRGPMLRIVGVKTFLDGGMLTGSAYLREPWGLSRIYSITDPQYKGLLFISRDRLVQIVRTAAESGLQFTAHSVGDGAVHTLLSVYEE